MDGLGRPSTIGGYTFLFNYLISFVVYSGGRVKLNIGQPEAVLGHSKHSCRLGFASFITCPNDIFVGAEPIGPSLFSSLELP